MTNSVRVSLGRRFIRTIGASIAPPGATILPVCFTDLIDLIFSMPPRAATYLATTSSAVSARANGARQVSNRAAGIRRRNIRDLLDGASGTPDCDVESTTMFATRECARCARADSPEYADRGT